MSKKTTYPKWFSERRKPTFYGMKPKEILCRTIEVDRIKLEDGYELNPSDFKSDLFYKISLDHNYDDCYYPGDTPSIDCYLIGYKLEECQNPKYDKELKDYTKAKKEHMDKCKEWKRLKEIWDKEEEDARILKEKEQLKKLKEKYEN